MKITNKFVEPIPLNTVDEKSGNLITLVENAQDGSRVAISPDAQTFDGTKTFENLRLDSDPDKGDRSLVNVADMNGTLADVGTPTTVTERVILTPADVAARGVTLEGTPYAGSMVRFSLEGSPWFNNVEKHFTVSGKNISWAANEELCDILEPGDMLYFRFYTIKEAA